MAKKKPVTNIFDDFEETDVSYDDEPPKRSIPGFIVRLIFYSIIIIINAAIVFRLCMSGDPKETELPEINDILKAAYAEDDKLEMYTQPIYDMFTKDGVFYAAGLYFSPDAEQLQVSIRYNTRIISGTLDNYRVPFTGYYTVSRIGGRNLINPSEIGNTATLASMQNQLLAYELYNVKTDELTAFRLVDADGNYYYPDKATRLEQLLYVYHKLTFNGVKGLGEGDFFIEIYPLDFTNEGKPDYSFTLGRMKIYNAERVTDEYKISKKALTE